ncbi:MAG TPA: hypothetical protein VGP93_20540, partial [Polyangiaceae bacterium]|nr:hypothetical protein [Polyangiaceae bacterium]
MRPYAVVALCLVGCSSSPAPSDHTSAGAGGSSGSTTGGASTTGGSATSVGGSGVSDGVAGNGGTPAGGTTATSGGTTAQGGSGGTEDLPLTPVANCDDLPTKDAGWHALSPPQANGREALSVVVDPYDQSVYGAAFDWGTHGTGVLKSTDCGATWNEASTGQNAALIESGGLWAMMIEPFPDKEPTLYA